MKVFGTLFATKFRENNRYRPITLPEYASQLLSDIEHLFGPRDHSFTLVGIDIDAAPGAFPRLWYPDSGIALDDPDRRSRHIIIRLTSNVLTDPARAKWQLAHECFHLLDPWNEQVDGRPSSWLEEGLAAWYQNNRVPEAEWHEGLYALAEDLVTPFMNELPRAIKLIRREQGLRISAITPDVLREYCPGPSEETLLKLCQPFQ